MRKIRRCFTPACVTVAIMVTAACSSYQDRVAPIPFPSLQSERVRVEGAYIVARSYVNKDHAKRAFGYDVRGAGLLPIRVVIENQGAHPVKLVGEQSFLIDRGGQAWPLLTADQAYDRVQRATEIGNVLRGGARPGVIGGLGGAIAGLAIGIVSGQNIADTAAKGAAVGAGVGAIGGGLRAVEQSAYVISDSLAQQTLRNERIMPGALAYGYLFYPGRNEATSAAQLRLAIEANGQTRVVVLPLKEAE